MAGYTGSGGQNTHCRRSGTVAWVLGLPERLPGRRAAGGGLTDGLSRALDPSLARPRLRADTEIVGFSTRSGERYTIVHSRRSGAYLRLTVHEVDFARRLDGANTVGELAIEQRDEDGKLDPVEFAGLVTVLRDHEFLDQPPVDTYAALRQRLLPRRRQAAERAWVWLRTQTIPVPGADAFAAAAYRAGGRLCLSRTANALAVAALVSGLAAFVALARRGNYALTGHVPTATAATLLGLGMVVLFVHEMGHALAVRHAGRRIVRAGFGSISLTRVLH